MSKTASAGEVGVVIALVYGWGMIASVMAALSGFPVQHGFTDARMVGLMVLELLQGGLALAFLRWRGHALRALLPRPTWSGCLWGVGLYLAMCFAWAGFTSLYTQADFAAQPVYRMLAHGKPSFAIAIAVSLVNGLYEETFILGYLVRALESTGASFALGVSVLLRLVCHLYQGPMGATSVCLVGLIFGLYYWRTRQLWPAVLAHILLDAAAFT